MCKTIQGVEFDEIIALFVAHNAEIHGLKSRIAGLEADKADLLEALQAKDELLLCYRMGKRPTEKQFARLEKANMNILKIYCNKENK